MCLTEQPIKECANFIGKHHENINGRCFPENILNPGNIVNPSQQFFRELPIFQLLIRCFHRLVHSRTQ